MDLQLLAEGGASGGDAGTGDTGGNQADAGLNNAGGAFANVDFSKRQDAPDAGEPDNPDVDLTAEFRNLINGKYKDAYNREVKNIVAKRLSKNKANENKLSAQLNALMPSVEILAAKYGISDLNSMEGINALKDAVASDNSLFQDEAMEKGIPVEQLRIQRGLELENAMLRRQQAQAQQDATYQRWQQEATDLKAIYPQFDIQSEVKSNPNFMRLLKSGVGVKAAFEASHIDEILPAAMQFAARSAEEKVSQSVASGTNRVVEGGGANQTAVNIKKDLSSLTKAERRALNERVMRGEVIEL